MSTPQPTGTPAVEKDRSKRRSIQRFVSKLIKPKSKKHESIETGVVSGPSTSGATATTTAVASTSTPGPAPALVSEPEPVAEQAAAPKETAPTPIDPPESAPTAEDESKEDPEIGVTLKSTAAKFPTLSHGARQLAEKHGIEIPEDWPYAPKAPIGERVQKPIRMRVRRYCHVCRTSFGSDKSCSSCGHKRCVDCPRSPPSKEKKKSKTKHKEYDPYEGLTLPGRNGGQDLVYRRIRQRVHYKCHKCEADFAGQRACPQCNHNRCKKCHREPSRKPKPIQEIRRKKPIKWTCCDCSKQSNITRNCADPKCAHPRCVDCVRENPKKKKKKAVLPLEVASAAAETKEEPTAGPSDIDKVSSALAATTIS